MISMLYTDERGMLEHIRIADCARRYYLFLQTREEDDWSKEDWYEVGYFVSKSAALFWQQVYEYSHGVPAVLRSISEKKIEQLVIWDIRGNGF